MSSNCSSVITPHSWRPVRLNQCCSRNVVRICCACVLASCMHDQDTLGAQTIPQHTLKTSKPPVEPSPAVSVIFMAVVASLVVASMRASEVMSVHSRVATSFPRAPCGIEATHVTASHWSSVRGGVSGKARYLIHVALSMPSTAENSYLWPNGSTTHSNLIELLTTTSRVRAPA